MALRYRWGPARLPLAAQAVSEGSNLIGRVPILKSKSDWHLKGAGHFFFHLGSSTAQ